MLVVWLQWNFLFKNVTGVQPDVYVAYLKKKKNGIGKVQIRGREVLLPAMNYFLYIAWSIVPCSTEKETT